jgi:DNA-binding transcriptional LysR family regulator
MLDPHKLRLLRDLSRRGTIAAVAEALRYTPSAVSQQLAALEREAGAPLLARTGRRVTLTPAGVVLAEQAEAVLAALERAQAAVAATGRQLTGPLRIGAFPTAVRTLLPGALVALGHDHPGLELMVDEIDPAAAPEALRTGRLDLALVHEYDFVPSAPEPGLDAEPLLDEVLYLAAAEPLESIEDCRAWPWILGSPGTLCHAMSMRACQAAGFLPRVRHHVDDFVAVLALVTAGQGVAIVPQLALADAPVAIHLTPLPAQRHTRIAYRQGAAGHPAVAAGIQALRVSAADSAADQRSDRSSPSAAFG